MSCRVIGRRIEMSICPRSAQDAVRRGCRELHAEFIPSPKNALVTDFYDRLGLHLSSETAAGVRRYRCDVDTFVGPRLPGSR